jgi:hypothetical protein
VSSALSEDTLYYWRARAEDNHGAISDWVNASFFVNVTNIASTAPSNSSPAIGSEVTIYTPSLTVANALDPDSGTLNYIFELDTVNTFNSANKQTSDPIAEGVATTSWTLVTALSENNTYYWRAKANDGMADSPWSATGSFFVNAVNEAPTAPTLINVTLSLPAGVTVASSPDSGNPAILVTNSGKVAASGVAVGGNTYMLATYEPAAAVAKVIIHVANPNGFTVGEFVTVNCDISAGHNPAVSDFSLSGFVVKDLNGVAINGLNPVFTAVFQ